MHTRKIVSSCLLIGSLLVPNSFGQSRNEWTIKPPRKTYPVDPTTSATLTSVSDDSVTLALSVKPEHISLPKPQDVAYLSIILDVGDAALKTEPTKWNSKHELVSYAGIRVELAFDGDKPLSDLWGGGTGAAIWTDPAQDFNTHAFTQSDFITRLQRAKSLTISYLLQGGTHKTATFDVSNAGTAIAAITNAGWQPPPSTPSDRISPDMIEVGKAILALMPEVVDPKTHDSAVAQFDKVKAVVKESTPDSNADAAALNDFLNLYAFAAYMYDTREHWIKRDPQFRLHPQNMLLLRPYADCWQKVSGELDTGVAMSSGNVGCDLSVIAEH